MTEWLVNLPIIWMALVIFLGTYLVAAAVYLIVMRLAGNDRVRAFKGLSPGMLPPLGILFGLLVGFMAAQVWSDFERAKLAVGTEASALRTAINFAETFTGDTETRIRTLINRHNGGEPGMTGDGATARNSQGLAYNFDRSPQDHACLDA